MACLPIGIIARGENQDPDHIIGRMPASATLQAAVRFVRAFFGDKELPEAALMLLSRLLAYETLKAGVGGVVSSAHIGQPLMRTVLAAYVAMDQGTSLADDDLLGLTCIFTRRHLVQPWRKALEEWLPADSVLVVHGKPAEQSAEMVHRVVSLDGKVQAVVVTTPRAWARYVIRKGDPGQRMWRRVLYDLGSLSRPVVSRPVCLFEWWCLPDAVAHDRFGRILEALQYHWRGLIHLSPAPRSNSPIFRDQPMGTAALVQAEHRKIRDHAHRMIVAALKETLTIRAPLLGRGASTHLILRHPRWSGVETSLYECVVLSLRLRQLGCGAGTASMGMTLERTLLAPCTLKYTALTSLGIHFAVGGSAAWPALKMPRQVNGQGKSDVFCGSAAEDLAAYAKGEDSSVGCPVCFKERPPAICIPECSHVICPSCAYRCVAPEMPLFVCPLCRGTTPPYDMLFLIAPLPSRCDYRFHSREVTVLRTLEREAALSRDPVLLLTSRPWVRTHLRRLVRVRQLNARVSLSQEVEGLYMEGSHVVVYDHAPNKPMKDIAGELALAGARRVVWVSLYGSRSLQERETSDS